MMKGRMTVVQNGGYKISYISTSSETNVDNEGTLLGRMDRWQLEIKTEKMEGRKTENEGRKKQGMKEGY